MIPIAQTLRGASLLIALLGAIAAPRAGHGQQTPAPADSAQVSPVGTWRGTSLCTPGHPACHDETVVYRITAVGARFQINASKIVQGQEEWMGNIDCDWAPATRAFTCPASYGLWSFTITGAAMTGTLVVRGELFRNVSVSRAAS